jgi:beta-aspartyl-peptidase (threonine type)
MPDDRSGWVLICHGGAKDIAPEQEAPNREGLRDALKKGVNVLSNGGSALDAVEAVVQVLEENPTYNAGLRGSVRNEDGEIEMDASIMDGATLDIGAVAGLRLIKHPVAVARALLREKEILLVGEGAMKFALQKGFTFESEASASAQSGCDTVGCVARDRDANLAVATSTGGLEGARAGRVGDVPLPGCGFYADNARGAISASGEGEAIARAMVVAEALRLAADLGMESATHTALQSLQKVQGEGGLIAIAPDGAIGWSHNSRNFAIGIAREIDGEDFGIHLKKSEQ